VYLHGRNINFIDKIALHLVHLPNQYMPYELELVVDPKARICIPNP